MRHLRRQGLIALFAVCALLAAMSAFVAHGHGDVLGAQDGPQCELCLQLTGSATAPEPEGIVTRTTHFDRLGIGPAEPLPVSRKPDSVHLPRAPPAHA